jgi:hypothetical protein
MSVTPASPRGISVTPASRRAAVCTAAILAAILFSPFLFAQTPCRGVKLANGYADFNEDPLTALSNTYFSGDWQKLQRDTIELLNQLQFHPANKLDFQKDYFSVVFVYKDPQSANSVLRYLVHGSTIQPYESRLPGIKAGDSKKFYEVFLTLNEKNVLVSTYISTKEKNPLEAQIPKFLKQFDPKEIGPLIEPALPTKRVYAVLSRIDLPYERASISIEDVVQGAEKAKETSKLFNRPLTRFSFGLVSSIMAGSSMSDTRVSIQNGKIAEDPLSGHMPMGILNIHPWTYDADADRASWKERIRLFVGGIFAPEFGFSAGAGLQIVRGFTLNAGVGVLLIDTLKEGETIGVAPVNRDHPFDYGTATVFFVGVGYNF